jgi:recombination protein RecA
MSAAAAIQSESPHAATVLRLREHIRKLQAAPRSYLSVLRTRVAAFDSLFPAEGLPLGAALELCGEAASGRTSLALRAVAAAGREARLSAWVDGPGELYPPAAAALGVDLKRLLIARPKAPGQLVWTAVQLARSGAFTCVVLDLTHTGVRLTLAEGKKLAEAASRGGTSLLLLTPPAAPGDGMVRVSTCAQGIDGLQVEVVRSRQGGVGRQALIPWADLYPGTGPVYRPLVREESSLPVDVAPFRRPVKSNIRRDGYPGIEGGRPGRDAPLRVM